MKCITEGILIQDVDNHPTDPHQFRCVTTTQPTENQLRDLQFAWAVVRYVKSNAVVFAKNQKTISIGAGQMSRIDSINIAAQKANGKTTGCVMASDAFFPFRDAIDAAAKLGVSAIIQPGGSIRDQEVIDAANEAKIAMIFTGTRHFRH
jgi:phosphoribosylaminoimidazolecarboxamide formyltransferase/IMP cyclohydrolase